MGGTPASHPPSPPQHNLEGTGERGWPGWQEEEGWFTRGHRVRCEWVKVGGGLVAGDCRWGEIEVWV